MAMYNLPTLTSSSPAFILSPTAVARQNVDLKKVGELKLATA